LYLTSQFVLTPIEVQELQKENERMAKQLEEAQNQLANQVEKTFYEENQRILREQMC
jgi:predicted ATP-grasp superfamily ATP-dependent carboligase